MKLRIIPAVLLLLASFAPECFAQNKNDERILSFLSEITVHEDSTMTVTENIKVISSGSQIKRGIYRDFPTKYKTRYGTTIVDFRVLEVLRNGAKENYFIKSLNNGRRLYIGNKDTYLPPGEYIYTVKYKTDRQLGFFDKFDELYWNVTGNGWAFPIEEASAVIRLPQDAGKKVIESSGYTGRAGSKEQDVKCRAIVLEDYLYFNQVAYPGEGLTVVVAWPKGYVREPSFREKAGYTLRDNAGGAFALI
jgi:hypothetical protein